MAKRGEKNPDPKTPAPAFLALRRLMYAEIDVEQLLNGPTPDPGAAKQALLQRASAPGVESCVVLGAWRHLRSSGEQPPPKLWNEVLGVVMEVGLPDGGSYALAGYADGDARLLFSTGGGLPGETLPPAVAAAAKALVRAARRPAPTFRPEAEHPLPKKGRVRLVLLSPGGDRAAEEAEDAVQDEAHPLYGIFAAAVDLLTEFRLLHEGQAPDEDESEDEDAEDDDE